MIRNRLCITALIAAVTAIILILDSSTAIQAAADAVTLCMQVVIPSLFPLMVLSMLFTANTQSGSLRLLRPLGRLLGLPRGAEGLIMTSFVSGYPTGAKCIAQAHRAGSLSKEDAQAMMACFSNAGPSFIFGIAASQFQNPVAPWMLWAIQLLSGFSLALIIRSRHITNIPVLDSKIPNVPEILQSSIRSMANICGWILLFRCFLSYFDKWFMKRFHSILRVIIVGCFELTNGCMVLQNIDHEPIRFIICCVLMSFGGFCVIMQTQSVAGTLEIMPYILGKLIQSCFSAIYATSAAFFLYADNRLRWIGILFPCICTVFIAIFRIQAQKRKLTVAFPVVQVYNITNNA